MRAKSEGEEKKRRGDATKQFRGDSILSSRSGIFEKRAVKGREGRRGQLNNWLIKAAARFTDLLEKMRFREKRGNEGGERQITRTPAKIVSPRVN